MVSYPIHIARDNYRGRDPRKRQKAMLHNSQVADLERKINDMLREQTEPIKVYFWGSIAAATGHSYEFVQKVGYSIDCGNGGFTASAPGGISDLDAALQSL